VVPHDEIPEEEVIRWEREITNQELCHDDKEASGSTQRANT
jgi:hypothetical protein